MPPSSSGHSATGSGYWREALDVPFVIIDCDAPVNELRDRIMARRKRSDNVSDADLSVLDAQLESRESLSDGELSDESRRQAG